MPNPDAPNPGSDDAIAQGCRCAVLDNAHGKGYLGDDTPNPRTGKVNFVITHGCPLHWPAEATS